MNIYINGSIFNNCGKERQNFSETKCIDGNINKVKIVTSSTNVSFSYSDSDNIVAKLYGSCIIINSVPVLSINKTLNELNIFIEMPNNFIGDIALDIMLPKREYNKIIVIGQSSDVTINKILDIKSLNISTLSGNISGKVECEQIDLNTVSGNVDIILEAKSKIISKIQTISGNIVIKCNNVKSFRLYHKTISGEVSNNHNTTKDGGNVTISASTISGNIIIN